MKRPRAQRLAAAQVEALESDETQELLLTLARSIEEGQREAYDVLRAIWESGFVSGALAERDIR